MNYTYQLAGVPRMDGTTHHGFSYRVMPTLDESALAESAGFGTRATGWKTSYRTPSGSWVTQNARALLDYDGDGRISSAPISRDLNGDGSLGLLTGPSDVQTLHFPAGVSGGITSREAPVPVTNELTADEAERRQSHSH